MTQKEIKFRDMTPLAKVFAVIMVGTLLGLGVWVLGLVWKAAIGAWS